MRGHSSVPIVDVREDLRRAKQVERVYDVTDSHWNSSGGYIAYERHHAGALRMVSERRQCRDRSSVPWWITGPAATSRECWASPIEFQKSDRSSCPEPAGISTTATNLSRSRPGPRHPELTLATEWADAELPRAVLFRDSFAAQLIPFLAEHFQRILCVWDRDFNRAIIEHEHPGVVIQEVVERSLEAGMPVDR